MPCVMITGSSRGLGNAIKQKFMSEGYDCVCPSREELDLSDTNSIDEYINNIDFAFDVLINNAAINIKSELNDIKDSDVELMVNTNLIAPLKLMQCAAKKMAESGSGKVVNIGSIWGVRSLEHRTLYSMTKFGLDGMTRSLAREFGGKGILFNTVAPGFMKTEMTNKNLDAETQQKIMKEIPLSRFADPVEMAELVFFLSSSKNSYITGQTIVIDGGFLA